MDKLQEQIDQRLSFSLLGDNAKEKLKGSEISLRHIASVIVKTGKLNCPHHKSFQELEDAIKPAQIQLQVWQGLVETFPSAYSSCLYSPTEIMNCLNQLRDFLTKLDADVQMVEEVANHALRVAKEYAETQRD